MAVGNHVLIRQRILSALVRMRNHAAIGNEDVRPFSQRLGLHMLEQPVAKRLHHIALPAHRIALVLLIPQFIGKACGTKEVGQQVRQQIAKLQPFAVLGTHRMVVERGHGLGAVPGNLGTFQNAFVPKLRHRHDAHLVRHHPPEQRGIEEETVATGFAPDERGQRCRRRRLRRGMNTHLQRRVVGPVPLRHTSKGLHPPRLGRHNRLVARIIGVRPVLAEATDHANHQVLPTQRFRTQSQPRSLLPVQRRQHRIRRLRDHLPQPRLVTAIAQIRANDALTPRPKRPGTHAGKGIAIFRNHLDNVRTEVRQDHGGKPRRRANADFYNAKTRKGKHEYSSWLVFKVGF